MAGFHYATDTTHHVYDIFHSFTSDQQIILYSQFLEIIQLENRLIFETTVKYSQLQLSTENRVCLLSPGWILQMPLAVCFSVM